MKFIRDIIGEKRHQPRQDTGFEALDALTKPVPEAAPEALRLEPEHRIMQAATLQEAVEFGPEGFGPEDFGPENFGPEDWGRGAEDDYDPAEGDRDEGFATPLDDLTEAIKRDAEKEPDTARAVLDDISRAAWEDAPRDVSEVTGDAQVQTAREAPARTAPEAPAQSQDVEHLTEADLSAWLEKVDPRPVSGTQDRVAPEAAEDAPADHVAGGEFAEPLRAVKDMMGQVPAPEPTPVATTQADAAPEPASEAAQVEVAAEAQAEAQAGPVDVPTPALGRGSSRPGRVKTRLLGFNPEQAAGLDPLARPKEDMHSTCASFPVGWLVVIKGPGRGAAVALQGGVAQIGRGAGQTVRLDFGDNSISRETHAAVAYDDESQSFYIGHGGKANLVRRNGRPVLSTEDLSSGDLIVIGETTLRFVALCGPDFSWAGDAQGGQAHASRG